MLKHLRACLKAAKVLPTTAEGTANEIPILKPLKKAAVLAEEYRRTLPPYRLHGPLPRFTNSTSVLDDYLSKVSASSSATAVTAFDLEWTPSIRRGQERRTGMVQICHQAAGILLYSAPRGEHDQLPASLQEYIANDKIYKLGVQINGDALKLRRDWPKMAPLAGKIELNNVARYADPEEWHNHPSPLASLQRLTATYLKRYLDKGSVRLSNWEGMLLPKAQLDYAAKDVRATLDIYDALVLLASQKGKQLDLAQLSGSFSFKGSADAMGPSQRMLQAWELVFGPPTSPTEVRWEDVQRAGHAMTIKDRSVLMYCLATVQRSPGHAAAVSPRQAARFVVLADAHFQGFQPEHIASPLLAFRSRAASTAKV